METRSPPTVPTARGIRVLPSHPKSIPSSGDLPHGAFGDKFSPHTAPFIKRLVLPHGVLRPPAPGAIHSTNPPEAQLLLG